MLWFLLNVRQFSDRSWTVIPRLFSEYLFSGFLQVLECLELFQLWTLKLILWYLYKFLLPLHKFSCSFQARSWLNSSVLLQISATRSVAKVGSRLSSAVSAKSIFLVRSRRALGNCPQMTVCLERFQLNQLRAPIFVFLDDSSTGVRSFSGILERFVPKKICKFKNVLRRMFPFNVSMLPYNISFHGVCRAICSTGQTMGKLFQLQFSKERRILYQD